MKTMVISLGNRIIGDNGEGWLSAQELQIEKTSDVSIECLSIGGVSVMEAPIGFDRVIFTDGMITHQVPGRSVNHDELEDFPNPTFGQTGTDHDSSVYALQVGQSLLDQIPVDVSGLSGGAQEVAEFTNTLPPANAVNVRAARIILLGLLIESNSENPPKKDCLRGEEKLL